VGGKRLDPYEQVARTKDFSSKKKSMEKKKGRTNSANGKGGLHKSWWWRGKKLADFRKGKVKKTGRRPGPFGSAKGVIKMCCRTTKRKKKVGQIKGKTGGEGKKN